MAYLADIVVVGGNGGGPFDFNGIENGATLKKICLWAGDWVVKAMKVWFTDGRCKQFGEPAGKFSQFIFEDGEHFTSLSLWMTGDGTRLGAIEFKTNHSREFFARMRDSNSKPEVPVDVASGICIGVKGSSGADIDRLGFMFLNTIKSTVLTDVEYPTLLYMIPKVSVMEIKSMTYHNNTTTTQEYRIETSNKITPKSSWSFNDNLEAIFSLEVKAGIPVLADGTAGLELKLGDEVTYASTTTEEKVNHHLSFPFQVPPGKTVDVNVTTGQATVDLPFKGTVKIACHNGGELQFKTVGTYKGVIYTSGNIVVNESDKNLDLK